MKRSAKNYCPGIKGKSCGRVVTQFCKRCDKYADASGNLEVSGISSIYFILMLLEVILVL